MKQWVVCARAMPTVRVTTIYDKATTTYGKATAAYVVVTYSKVAVAYGKATTVRSCDCRISELEFFFIKG
ncbi:hypothetical protein B296_00000429 [Ensete ventricosum]|uniref:Uncharacterized protein n=1 Tax=Ensete ventricosum TaxID=4639 RepID=A0A427BBR7_ENSVE|nr:hypothetical protein B296_00000429 [Ensete ventricosum]